MMTHSDAAPDDASAMDPDNPESLRASDASSTDGAGRAGGDVQRGMGGSGTGGLSGSGTGGIGGIQAGNGYVWIAISDSEQVACTTHGPGSDIDAISLNDAMGVRGWGRLGSAHFTPNPLGNACENDDCVGGDCQYAWIGTTFDPSSLVALTEGPVDAYVDELGGDHGYLSINAGTLQIQIGNAVDGLGPAQELRSGDFVVVHEFDQSYVASGAAPADCTCRPEHYQVWVQTITGYSLALKPVQLDEHNLTCTPLTANSSEGCGSTVFIVP